MKKILALSLLVSLTALSSIKSMDQQKISTHDSTDSTKLNNEDRIRSGILDSLSILRIPLLLEKISTLERISTLENEVIEREGFFKKSVNIKKFKEAVNIFTQNIEISEILEAIESSFLNIIKNIKSNLNRIKPDKLKSIQDILNQDILLNKVNDTTGKRTRHTEEIKKNIEEILLEVEDRQENAFKAFIKKLGTPVLKLIKIHLSLLQRSIPLHGLKQFIDKNVREGFQTLTENGKNFIILAIIVYAESYGITKVLQMLGLTKEQYLGFIYSAPYEFIKENLISLIVRITRKDVIVNIKENTLAAITNNKSDNFTTLKNLIENIFEGITTTTKDLDTLAAITNNKQDLIKLAELTSPKKLLAALAELVTAKKLTRIEWFEIAEPFGIEKPNWLIRAWHMIWSSGQFKGIVKLLLRKLD